MTNEKMTDKELNKWLHESLNRHLKEESLFVWSLYFLERAKGEGDPKKQKWVDKPACRIFSKIICLYSDSLKSITDELDAWERHRDFERTLDEVAESERDVLIALKHL